jgi:hypothetical protein
VAALPASCPQWLRHRLQCAGALLRPDGTDRASAARPPPGDLLAGHPHHPGGAELRLRGVPLPAGRGDDRAQTGRPVVRRGLHAAGLTRRRAVPGRGILGVRVLPGALRGGAPAAAGLAPRVLRDHPARGVPAGHAGAGRRSGGRGADRLGPGGARPRLVAVRRRQPPAVGRQPRLRRAGRGPADRGAPTALDRHRARPARRAGAAERRCRAVSFTAHGGGAARRRGVPDPGAAGPLRQPGLFGLLRHPPRQGRGVLPQRQGGRHLPRRGRRLPGQR